MAATAWSVWCALAAALAVSRCFWSIPDQSRPDERLCLFQPRLVVRGPAGTHPFVHREPGGTLPYEPDLESHRLLYRDCAELAVGHGCSVDWNDIEQNHAGVLSTTSIPTYELPATTPNTMAGLEMQALADAINPAMVAAILNPLLDAYAAWIT